jgi:hypothetical protein
VSTALKQVVERDITGDLASPTIQKSATILLLPLLVIHFFISVTVGKDMNVERKSLMTKSCNECLETSIMGSSREFNELSSALYIMHSVLGVCYCFRKM